MSGELTRARGFLTRRKGSAVSRRGSGAVGEVIGAFESDTVAVFVRTSPVNENITLQVFSALIIAAVVRLKAKSGGATATFTRHHSAPHSSPFWNRRAIGFPSGDGHFVYVTPDAIVIAGSH